MTNVNKQQLYSAPIYNAGVLTQRETLVLKMFWNRAGVPDPLFEVLDCFFALGNWKHTEWDEINTQRIARKLATDGNWKRIYERLRKKIVDYYLWQDAQYFKILIREPILNQDYKKGYKERYRYNLLLYKDIVQVISMPENSFHKDIQAKVEDIMVFFPSESKPPLERQKRSTEEEGTRILRAMERFIDKVGSEEMAGLELQDLLDKSKWPDRVLKFLQTACQK